MLIVKFDETGETSDSSLDERSVEFSVSLKRGKDARYRVVVVRPWQKGTKSGDSRRNSESWQVWCSQKLSPEQKNLSSSLAITKARFNTTENMWSEIDQLLQKKNNSKKELFTCLKEKSLHFSDKYLQKKQEKHGKRAKPVCMQKSCRAEDRRVARNLPQGGFNVEQLLLLFFFQHSKKYTTHLIGLSHPQLTNEFSGWNGKQGHFTFRVFTVLEDTDR